MRVKDLKPTEETIGKGGIYEQKNDMQGIRKETY
jgi:hypothetical protein